MWCTVKAKSHFVLLYCALLSGVLVVVVLEAITKLIHLIGAYKRMLGLFRGTPHRAMTNVAKLVTAWWLIGALIIEILVPHQIAETLTLPIAPTVTAFLCLDPAWIRWVFIIIKRLLTCPPLYQTMQPIHPHCWRVAIGSRYPGMSLLPLHTSVHCPFWSCNTQRARSVLSLSSRHGPRKSPNHIDSAMCMLRRLPKVL